DDLAQARSRDGVGDRGERHMPAPGPVTGDPVGLHPLGDGTGPAEPHPAHLRDPHLPHVPRQTAHITHFDRDDPEPLTPPAFAPGRTTVGSAEEIAYGLREVLQRLLLDDDRPRPQPRECRPRLGQLPALLGEPRRTLASRLPMRVLLNREI